MAFLTLRSLGCDRNQVDLGKGRRKDSILAFSWECLSVCKRLVSCRRTSHTDSISVPRHEDDPVSDDSATELQKSVVGG